MSGYQTDFFGRDEKVDYPDYEYYKHRIAKNQENGSDTLDYIFYSVVQDSLRRVPVFSASNINRIQFLQEDREGDFKCESRIGVLDQLGENDYKIFNKKKPKTVDKGHMTKREDVQWDENNNTENAIRAAKSTFFYPNAAPQHHRLNRVCWKLLENSIIIKGRVRTPEKVSVFTGPVLDDQDPVFVLKLADQSEFQMPVLFWKIVYYIKADDLKLYYAGFLMGQLNLLKEDKLINIKVYKGPKLLKPHSLRPFLEFNESHNYQVPVSTIESLTNLKFQSAIDRHDGLAPISLQSVQAKKIGLDTISLVENINV